MTKITKWLNKNAGKVYFILFIDAASIMISFILVEYAPKLFEFLSIIVTLATFWCKAWSQCVESNKINKEEEDGK